MARPGFMDKFGEGKKTELSHVLRNLESVLNTKQGYGFFQKGFGLSDFTGDDTGGDIAQYLTDEFQRSIVEFEPRLQDVEVKLHGRDGALWLHFDVNGRLGEEELKLSLSFDTVSNRVSIRRKG